jgi:hypothetical protein
MSIITIQEIVNYMLKERTKTREITKREGKRMTKEEIIAERKKRTPMKNLNIHGDSEATEKKPKKANQNDKTEQNQKNTEKKAKKANKKNKEVKKEL